MEEINMEERNCGNCNFFIENQCRKYTPQVIPTTMIDPNFGNILMAETVWPGTSADQWCGEWEVEEIPAEVMVSEKVTITSKEEK